MQFQEEKVVPSEVRQEKVNFNRLKFESGAGALDTRDYYLLNGKRILSSFPSVQSVEIYSESRKVYLQLSKADLEYELKIRKFKENYVMNLKMSGGNKTIKLIGKGNQFTF